MRNARSTLVYKWFDEVWNKNNENAIDNLMANDTNHRGIMSEDQENGVAGFKIFFNDFRSKFHNIEIEVEDVISQDDIECARTMVKAIHTESNKAVIFSGMCMVRIAEGKITEAWNNYDFLNLYQQLGQKLTSSFEIPEN